MSVIADLERWYESQCDEDWEHAWGVTIGTVDNPGWTVMIDLDETYLEGVAFEPVIDIEPERDWVRCEVREHKFIGSGGPRQLERIISTFLGWAREHEAVEPTAAGRR